MRIFLAGATGRTGRQILQQARPRGHQITALVRGGADRLDPAESWLRILNGDLLDHPNLAQIVANHDAIITALSGSVVEPATLKLIDAAQVAKVPRFLGLAGGGILQLDAHSLRRDRPDYPATFRTSSEGHLRAWKALEASTLDWTLVCTPDLLDTPATGRATALADFMPQGGKSVPRADVAAFMMTELDQPRFSRKRVGLTV